MTEAKHALPVNTLKEALKQFQHWTGMSKIRDLHKSGAHVAGVFYDVFSVEKFCVTLKKEWYNNFSTHFPDVPEKGFGQITSLTLLLYCEQAGIAWLVAVMPQGVAYKIDVAAFLRYYFKYRTDVPHLRGEVASPIKMWTRLYPAT